MFMYIYMYYTTSCISPCVTFIEQCCEHYSVNIHLSIVSLKEFYPACPCTKQVYLHLHLLHCHLHITMCHHLWTLLCEHICVNIHLPIVSLNAIVPCMSMHNASLSTSTSTTLPLAYHHVSPSVNTAVWTHLCEHPSTNCFFKCYCTMHVHAQCKFIYIYIYYTATCISPCVTICEQCVNTRLCIKKHVSIVTLNWLQHVCPGTIISRAPWTCIRWSFQWNMNVGQHVLP